MSSPFKKEDTFTVKEIREHVFERRVSIRHIYDLIERGAFGDGNVYRFAGRRGTCILKSAAWAYKENCRLEM